ncbi:MAG TPA: outer membrane protein assembly factor BamC [Ideonella sp.]|nr:outer membrane protein assembly factor BamC [Ideonella sp.]
MTRPVPSTRVPVALAVALGLAALAGCSSIESTLSGDKVDYKSATMRDSPLDVPPDLTQLARDARYQPSSGTVSASSFRSTPAVPSTALAASAVAPGAVGDMHIERAGSERWLVTELTPEQLWPQLRAFWQERGFNLAVDDPATGVMETGWAENRAKLPLDPIRSAIGKALDQLYSTGERDKFRTRVERRPDGKGSEVYISHRGMEEVYNGSGENRNSTVWQPRAADPQLEATMLSRLMLKLGAKEEADKAQAAAGAASAASAASAAATMPPRARVLAGQPGAALQVDEGFDRAWRRVGLALDRGGFTVEDRDRSAGLYYVRYVDPAKVGKEEPGFFSRLFSGEKKSENAPARYRVALKSAGAETTVSVQDAKGAPESGDVGQRIVSLLVAELK